MTLLYCMVLFLLLQNKDVTQNFLLTYSNCGIMIVGVLLCIFMCTLVTVISYRMGKLRLSVHRKSEIRKKYNCFYRIRIPRDSVSILHVSIPLAVLPFRVSLPLHFFSTSPVVSLPILRKRIHDLKILPQGKFVVILYDCT